MDGNTLGKIVGQASATSSTASEANPPVVPETKEEKGFWQSVGNWFVEQGENLGEAAQHPWEATKGAAKGLWNMVPDLGTLVAQGGIYQATADMENSAAMMSLYGMEEQSKDQSQLAEDIRANAHNVNFNDYRLAMSNKAQEGGDLIATVGTLFLPEAWLGKAGKLGKLGRLGKADEVFKVVDEAADITKSVDKVMDGVKTETQATKEVAEEIAEEVEKKVVVESGAKIKPRSNTEGATFGEKMAHEEMLDRGMEPLGKTDGVYRQGHNGIDGVYKNPSPPPDYIITEAKYNTSKLNKNLADDSNQMDNRWVSKRLSSSVGFEKAAKIQEAMESGGVEKWLIKVKPDGNITIRKIDYKGNVIRGKKGVVK